MKTILHFKHWQLFILIIIGGAWVSPEPFQSVVNGISAATFTWWIYAICIFGNEKIRVYGLKPMNLNLFRINLVIIFAAMLFGFIFPSLMMEESNESIRMIDVPFIAGGIYLVFAFFHVLLFTAKTIAMITERREVTFGDYFINLILFSFLFVWLWILQPKLNRIFSDEVNSTH